MLDLCTTMHSTATLAPPALSEPPPHRRPAPVLANPLLRQLLDIFSTGVVLVDERGQVLHANPAALTLCHADAALALVSGQLQLSLVQRQRLDTAWCPWAVTPTAPRWPQHF